MQSETISHARSERFISDITIGPGGNAGIADANTMVPNYFNPLYADYFEEVSKVKSAITTHHRVKEIIHMQARLVAEYNRAYAQFKND